MGHKGLSCREGRARGLRKGQRLPPPKSGRWREVDRDPERDREERERQTHRQTEYVET